MNSYKVVFISTVPRTGSMWVYNFARDVLRHAGREVVPELVPKTDREVKTLAAQALLDGNAKRIWVLKTHELVQPGPPSKIIYTVRDPRDTVLSYQRFMQCPIDLAMRCVSGFEILLNSYRHSPADLVHPVRYEDIENKPTDVARNICHFLKVRLPDSIIASTLEKYSKSRVVALTEHIERRVQEKIKRGDEVDDDDIVDIGRGRFRAFDTATGFQTGHVLGKESGYWREAMPEELKRIFREEYGDLIARLGYPPD